MEATATDVPHIAELDALVTVDRCWFPEVFVIPMNNGSAVREGAHHNASPWSSRPICLGTSRQCLERHHST